MKYHFKVHTEANGFWAECIELPGCHSQGDTKVELMQNLEEALNLYLSEPADSKHIFPRPLNRSSAKSIVAVAVSPSVAFANRLREFRLRCKLTQHQMKDRLGIKHLSNYQRLEDPQRANPELQTMCHIKRQFPKFRFEDLFVI